jgi:hypothetical protein
VNTAHSRSSAYAGAASIAAVDSKNVRRVVIELPPGRVIGAAEFEAAQAAPKSLAPD